MRDETQEIRTVKQPTSFEEQLKKIEKRGCIIGDKTWAKEVLKQINYYRLTAYFLPYKDVDETYVKGTTFNNMYRTYEFDRKLRQLLFSVIEEIEIMLRAQISYYYAHKYGSLGYTDKNNFNKKHNHKRFLEQIEKDIQSNKNQPMVKHHKEHYDGNFPIWVVVELFTIGQLSFFYSDMIRADKKAIAKNLYGTTDKNVESWIKCLTDLRNFCAHYSRLYNANLVSIPATPDGFSYYLKRKVFDYIVVLKFLYFDKIKWSNEVVLQIETLIEEYSDSIELERIGFPENWKSVLKEKVPTIPNIDK